MDRRQADLIPELRRIVRRSFFYSYIRDYMEIVSSSDIFTYNVTSNDYTKQIEVTP